MKNVKRLVTYGIILLLILVGIGGFLLSKQSEEKATFVGLNLDPQTAQKHIAEVMKKSAVPPQEEPVVGIAQGHDYSKTLREAVANGGGLEGVVKDGDVVIIKPNLIRGTPAEGQTCTNHRIVQELANMIKELGASRIIVAEASPAGNVFKEALYDTITGVELLDMNECKEEDCYKLKPENSWTSQEIYIPKIYMDADVVIGAAKLKTHQSRDAVVTLGLKLSMGVPPAPFYFGGGSKDGLHQMGLQQVIFDLNAIRRPDFVVIDGIIGGEGFGPIENTPVDSGIIFAAQDVVALDTVALTYMGFTIDEVPHVALAAQEGMGIADLEKIKVVGADLNSIIRRFRRAYE